MERSLLWSVFAIGVACWLSGFALTRRRRLGTAGLENALPRPYLLAAVGLPILLFLATLPSRPPLFAPGHDLGNGFLLGGLGALLSALVLIQGSLSDPNERGMNRGAALVAAPYALGVACTAVPLLFTYDTLVVALLGVAIGWMCVTTILLFGLLHGKSDEASKENVPLLPMVAGIGFVALLCATVALGDDHGKVTFIVTSNAVSWGVVGLVFAAGIPFFLLLSSAPGLLLAARTTTDSPAPASKFGSTGLWRVLIAVGGLAILGKLLAHRVVDAAIAYDGGAGFTGRLMEMLIGPSRLYQLMGIGLLVGLLAWWITASRFRQETESNAGPSPMGWQNGALAILVVLAGAMAAYQMLAGFGVGVMLLGAWLSVGLALLCAQETVPTTTEPYGSVAGAAGPLNAAAARIALQMVRLGLFGAGLVLYRLFTTQFDTDARSNALTDQYALFGFLAGVALPLLLSGFLLRAEASLPQSPFARLFRLLVTAALLLAVPALILLLWGEKCTLTLLVGLALSTVEVGSGAGGIGAREMLKGLFPAMLALGIALALNEWADHVLPMAEWTRLQKEHLLVEIVGGLIVLILVADYSGRINTWRKSLSQPVSQPKGAAR